MKLIVARVYWHTITKENKNGVLVEVSRTSPVMTMVAAERQDQLIKGLPKPEVKPGFIVENHVTQIDTRHRDVSFAGE